MLDSGPGEQSGIDEARPAGYPAVGTGLAAGAVLALQQTRMGRLWSMAVSAGPGRGRQDRLSIARGRR
jgi:hypothetical protein